MGKTEWTGRGLDFGSVNENYYPMNEYKTDTASVTLTDAYKHKTVQSELFSFETDRLVTKAGLLNAMSHIFDLKNPESRNGTGYCLTEDGGMLIQINMEEPAIYNSDRGINTWNDADHLCMHITKDGFVYASIVHGNGSVSPFIISNRKRCGSQEHYPSLLLFGTALYAAYNEFEEKTAQKRIQEFIEPYLSRISFSSTEQENILNLTMASNNILHCLDNYINVKNALGGHLIDDSSMTPQLKEIGELPEIIRSSVTGSVSCFFGINSVTGGQTFVYRSTVASMEEVAGKFVFDAERVLNEEEQIIMEGNRNAVKDMQMTPEVLRACAILKHHWDTHGQGRHMLMVSEAGLGKSTAAEMIGVLTGRPVVQMTLSQSTMQQDLLCTLMPRTTATGSKKKRDLNLIDSIMQSNEPVFNPVSAYKKLTGNYISNVTYKDVIQEYKNILLSQCQQDNTPEFMAIPSPLLRAYENGWCCVINEVNLAKPDVMTALNDMFDGSCQVYVPVEGRYAKRHPAFNAVATMNHNYEGTRVLNQSFISRFNLLIQMELPDLMILISRIKYMSGSSDEENIKKCISVMKNIRIKEIESGITSGITSIREVVSWIETAEAMNGDYYNAAKLTIIPSASLDPDDQAELMLAVAEKFSDAKDSSGIS